MKKFMIIPFLCSNLLLMAVDEIKLEKERVTEVPQEIQISRIILSTELMQNKDSDDLEQISVQVPCRSEQIKKILKPFLGEAICKEVLQELKGKIIAYFESQESSLVAVYIPEQDVSLGELNIIVNPTSAGEITVAGNQWFSSEGIIDSFHVSKGEILHENDLLNRAAFINRNPFLQTNLIVSPGKQGTADLEILVNDRFPARFYAGADNTGVTGTGINRFYAGTMLSLTRYAQLTYQFTSAYNFPELLSHYGNLTVLLPWEHEVQFYGAYAIAHPEITDFASKGMNIQASMRYYVPIKPLYEPFQHQFGFGVDYKKVNNDVFYVGAIPDGSSSAPINQKACQLFQGDLCYGWNYSKGNLETSFKADLLFSPAEFLPDQKQVDYDSLRLGAKVKYVYGRLGLNATYRTANKCELTFVLRGQGSSSALLPTEQYGLGGYDTVRGYQESSFLADNAVIGNIELHAPKVHLYKKWKDELIFLAFADGAYGYNWIASPAFAQDAWLGSVGPGVRYRIFPYLSARMDYGFRFHDVPFGNSLIGRFHFSVMMGY